MSMKIGVSKRQQLSGLWVLMHPGPSLVTALAYALFAVLAARGRPDPRTLLVTVVGMIALQFAISALNDYCDREADLLSQKAKPVARGVLAPGIALGATAALIVLMVVCYAPYGLTPLAIVTAFLVLGIAYDLGLKSTPLGGVVMGLAFPLVPLLAWDLFARVTPALYWTFPLILALGIAVHLADALPDYAADSAASAHGLTQLLGDKALLTSWLCVVGANLLIVLLAVTGLTPARWGVLLTTAALVALVILAAALVARLSGWPERSRLRANFALTVAAGLITVTGWLLSAVL